MHALTRLPSALRTREALCGAVAILVACAWFKFGSFGLECAAFLVLWYALSAFASLLTPRPR
jgi:hypothetical protein